eukprot:7014970-Pyramimonas_sp.AAC.1
MRSTRAGPATSQDKMATRSVKRAIIEERKLYRNVCCLCPERADHRHGCPMRRPSRSPNIKRTPLAWSHDDGRGHCADPNATPYNEQLTESDYDRAAADEITRPSLVWKKRWIYPLRGGLLTVLKVWVG